jgi:hypothetical protein
MGSSNVGQWLKCFRVGNTDIPDQLCSGDLRTATTERNKRKIDELTRENQHVTVREVAAGIRIRHSAVQEIVESWCLVGFSLAGDGAQASMKKCSLRVDKTVCCQRL